MSVVLPDLADINIDVPKMHIDEYEPTKEEQEGLEFGSVRYKAGVAFLVLLLIQMVINFYELTLYGQAEQTEQVKTFVIQNIITMAMSASGAVLFLFLNRLEGKIKIEPYKSKSMLYFAIGIALPLGAQFIVTGLVGLRANVAAIDYFLLFLSLAVAEEMFFRAFLQTTLRNFLQQLIKSRLWASIIAVVIASTVFALMHVFVYTTIDEVLVILATGVALGASIEIPSESRHRFVDYSLVGHVFLNIVAGLQLIKLYYGGL